MYSTKANTQHISTIDIRSLDGLWTHPSPRGRVLLTSPPEQGKSKKKFKKASKGRRVVLMSDILKVSELFDLSCEWS